ncbi:MAG: dTDP-4-amino-4,6-dideoxy-D-glucose transaminase [Thermonema sp.]|uniref:dTDP-4-amino-4,6-dideoxygalactose transaminase n=1 Tax=Thermonema sp. TaxID=2231181 RepID=UPI0021DD01A9|nr:dTDP-4-amino-4,6-dideoxygalactose transaminase [Thermonema sp.]GIV38988.1 MAG: dTDP-4-amino-4,6-dideoxy-D-glucose transaminase [Thermonema sp.]
MRINPEDYHVVFNKPYLTGKEALYIEQAAKRWGHLSGNGKYTRLCQRFFEERYGFRRCLLTTSCTDALEMAALLLNIQPGDEVIMPSYTFVSTANAFVLRGAKIIFADSLPWHPNMDAHSIEALITPRTKAIVVVHYAGMANDMKTILQIAGRHGLYVVEDAAQAIDSYHKEGNRRLPLGSLGHLAAFSFHETKNIIAGEGGMLVINAPSMEARAEILWEKGTNRSAFFRGEVDKYNWVDVGSSFLPSEIIAAFLYAQLEHLEAIQQRRLNLWNYYYQGLKPLAEAGFIDLPTIPAYATNNAHMFYIVCRSLEERSRLIDYLKRHGILAVFHYQPLHDSPFYREKHDGRPLPNCRRFADCLLRLPLFYELTHTQQDYIIATIEAFYRPQKGKKP